MKPAPRWHPRVWAPYPLSGPLKGSEQTALENHWAYLQHQEESHGRGKKTSTEGFLDIRWKSISNIQKHCCVFLKQIVDIIYALLYGCSPSICFILVNVSSHPKQGSGVYPDPTTHPHTHTQVTENAGNCAPWFPFDSVNPKRESYNKTNEHLFGIGELQFGEHRCR